MPAMYLTGILSYMPVNFSKLKLPCPHCSKEISFDEFLKEIEYAVLPNLSPTEKAVVVHYARGKAIKEIRDLMRISVNTVKAHLHNAYKRLEVHNQLELVFVMLNAIPKVVKV